MVWKECWRRLGRLLQGCSHRIGEEEEESFRRCLILLGWEGRKGSEELSMSWMNGGWNEGRGGELLDENFLLCFFGLRKWVR